jgi:uncharacterized metal-binding protein
MWSQGWSVADIAAADAGVAIATLILSPDMDLFNSRSMDDWGLLRIFWWPYAKLVKHRDAMHIPLLGTTVRWAYMLIMLSLLIVPIAILLRRVGFKMTFQGDAEDISWYLGYLLDAFIGATFADAMHYILDITTTGIKHMIPHRHRERYERYAQNHSDQHHHYPYYGQTMPPEGERE